MKTIDFRSDTTTQQTPEMREAMFHAVVGDDVYGDDPSVNELEAYARDLFQSEDALFISSGTMGNQIAMMVHTHRNEEILTHSGSHLVQHEQAATSVLSQSRISALDSENDHLNPEILLANIKGNDIHEPKTACIEYENALSNGSVYTFAEMQAIRTVSQQYQIPVHIDGARIFNALIALNRKPADLLGLYDSLTFCLSKGLSAPVGSILIGSKSFIQQARKYRKMLGGGLRQAGYMAAAGLVALKTMFPQLEEDHQNALYLAEKLEASGYFKVDMKNLQINLLYYEITDKKFDSDLFQEYCQTKGIIIRGAYQNIGRLVTHYGITRSDIDYLISVLYEFIAK